MKNKNTTKEKNTSAIRTLVASILITLVVIDFVLSVEGILLSLPFQILIAKTTIFTILIMLYFYLSEASVEKKHLSLRLVTLIFFVWVLISIFLLPLSNLPSRASLYLGVSGTSIIMLYYYLCKRLSLSSTNAKSCK